jgi:hypothetical protein
MQVLAMYLPQFYNVEENNLWWGDGFTDWTTVRSADKLSEEHYQPKIPQNQNYYDLMKKDIMIWQSKLMKKYSLDGLCMYHYWFKDGRKILEKPAENLLRWKDIDMPYCFSWANETWARSWSSLQSKNVWANTFEPSKITESNGVLLEQKYGMKKEWKEHFEYLLPFFQDNRYIKIDGKPVFLIYKASSIPCLVEMIDFWRHLAIASGLCGLYIIGSNCNPSSKNSIDAELYHEPVRSRIPIMEAQTLRKNYACQLEYDDVWTKILESEAEGKTYFGGFVSYDDTPRRGKEGIVIEHATPDKFKYYLTELLAKNSAHGNSVVFLNAWNEWGEGMYLEPDEKFGEKFLEAVPYAKEHYLSKKEKYEPDKKKLSYVDIEIYEGLKLQKDKFQHYLEVLDHWMLLRENNLSLESYFLKAGYLNIALYGYGILGRHLYNELYNTRINVRYIVDQQKDKIHVTSPVYLPTENIPDVDALIVSATFFYDEIYRILKAKGIRNIISLETILYENNILY